MDEDDAPERIVAGPRGLKPSALEAAAWAARILQAPFADIAVVAEVEGQGMKTQLCVAMDVDPDILQQQKAVVDATAKLVGKWMRMPASVVPASSVLGQTVSRLGLRVYRARDHFHPAQSPVPSAQTRESFQKALMHDIEAAGNDAAKLYEGSVRAVNYGYYAVAFQASDFLLRVDDIKSRATTVRMLALNRCCLHEAAEFRARDYLRDYGEDPHVLLHLAFAISFQERREEAVRIAQHLVGMADKKPESFDTSLLRSAADLIREINGAAAAA